MLLQVDRPGIRAVRLRRVVEHVLKRERAPRAAEITVALISDAAIRRLNKRFLGKDCTTDVLSFQGDPPSLGDVAISVHRARVQAGEAGHAVGAEIALLAAHGVLHLLGYDDGLRGRRATMMRRQRALLGELGIEVRG